MSAEIIKQFMVGLGFEDTGATKGLTTALAGATTKVAVFAGAVVSAGASVFAGMLKVAQGEAALLDFSERTGVAVLSLKKMSYAAQLAGADAETAKASIEGFASAMGRVVAGLGARQKKALEALGLSVAKEDLNDIVGLMFKVGEKIKGMPRAQQAGILGRLGIDRKMVRLLTEGMGEYQDELKAIYGTNAEAAQRAAEAADDFEDEWFRVKTVSGSIVKKAYREMIVSSTGSLTEFRKLLLANFEKISKTVKAVVEGIGRAAGFVAGVLVKAIQILVPVFDLITRGLGLFRDLWASLSGPGQAAIAIFGAALAFWLSPLYATVAAVAAVIAIIDDFQTYLAGGKSAFPEFWGKWGDAILGAWNFTKAFFVAIKGIIDTTINTLLYFAAIAGRVLRLDFAGAKAAAADYIDTIKDINKTMGIGGGATPPARLGNLGPAPAGQTNQSVNAQTTINVNGVANPLLAAQLVGQNQQQVASDVVRFMKPVVR